MKTRPVTVDEARIADDEVVRQLELLLGSDMFKASKRCRTFLSFVVRQRLAGNLDSLREKVIGVEAFGRSNGYDTTEDPVVRITAGEVRKRLAQYYQHASQNDEIRFELLPGSYVPEFHRRAPVVAATPPDPVPAAETAPPVAPPTADPAVPPVSRLRTWMVPVAVALLILAGIWFWRANPTSFERFWEPTLSTHGPVLISIGQSRVYSLRKDLANAAELDLDPSHTGTPAHSLSKDFTVTARDVIPSWDRYVPLGDSMGVTSMAIFIHDRHREFRIRGSATTTLADLREGASILFGASSNDWTLRLNKDLRFRVSLAPDGLRYIHDQQEPASRKWKGTHVNTVSEAEYTDYAVLTRIFDATSGHPVISVGGITHLGTRAGGEFILSEEKMSEALQSAPAGWEKRNLQLVVSTKVIGASASPPQFVALHVW
ncbi:MAG TPA: hypothetical protein VFQ91_17465 [Bryobacteraceae bacterium]|nr:hypothetical protein [Bryobacteraceae bacterium]